MTPEQARGVQLSAAIVAAHLRGDFAERDGLFDEFGEPGPETLDQAIGGLAHLAIAIGEVLRGPNQDVNLATALGTIPEQTVDFMSVAAVSWPSGIAFALALANDDLGAAQRASSQMDVPGVMRTMMSLATSGVETLSTKYPTRTAHEWAQILTAGAALETI